MAFELFLRALMSPEESHRAGAEAAFEQLKNQPDALCGNFLITLKQSAGSDLRQFAAIMLRRVLCKDEPPLWTKCSSNIQVSDQAKEISQRTMTTNLIPNTCVPSEPHKVRAPQCPEERAGQGCCGKGL